MPAPGTGLTIRYAAAADGRTRPVNQDSAYASARLLAVADGTGSAGDRASAAAIEALKPLAAPAAGPGDLLNALAQAAEQASMAVRDIAAASPSGDSGTTLTATLLCPASSGLVHIGTCATCSRAASRSGSPTITPWCRT